MRSIIIFLSIFVFVGNIIAQTQKPIASKELIGVWQIDDALISSAYQKCFAFYKNGKFVLHYSEYDELARIKSVTGKYYKKDSLLYLQIESRMELIGGKLVSGSPGVESEEFVLEGAKHIIVKQRSGKPETFDITTGTSENGVQYIQINNNKYYKIFSDPNKYTN